MAMSALFTIFTLLLFVGGHKDLLDFVNTKHFWKTQEITVTEDEMLLLLAGQKPKDASKWIAQLADDEFEKREAAFNQLKKMGSAIKAQLEEGAKSDDAEVAERCKELIKMAKDAAGNKGTVELMAIRTLGELKSKKALGVLKKIAANDKRAFYAEYAQRSIAMIEGKAVAKKTIDYKILEKDLKLIPANTGIVGQAIMQESDLGELEKAMADITKQMMAASNPNGNNEEIDTEGMLSEMALEVVNQFGNMSIEAMTMSISADINTRGRDKGHIAYVLRGKMDYDRLIAGMVRAYGDRMGPDRQEEVYEKKTVNGQEVHIVGRWSKMAFIKIDANRLAIVMGPRELDDPINDLTAAIAKPDEKGLFSNKKILAEVKKVDKTNAIAWVASVVPDGVKEIRELGNIFSGLNTVHGTLKIDGDFLVLDEMQREIDRGRRMKALAEIGKNMLNPMKFTADGKKASWKMKLDKKTGMQFFPLMMGSMTARRQMYMKREVNIRPAAGVAPVEVQVQ